MLYSIEIPMEETINRESVEPSRKYKTFHHSGVWEYNPQAKEYMWSDTGSNVYESKGDVIKYHNPDRYVLDSMTLGQNRFYQRNKTTNQTFNLDGISTDDGINRAKTS